MKKGLKEFQKVYDNECSRGWLFLDLAQNLRFRFQAGNKEITEDDIELCGKIFRLEQIEAIHDLAHALGYTGKDYVENKNKRTGRGKCNIYIAGVGSIENMEEADHENPI